ncbi:hypothetical protein VNO77_02806 [Canavalia gladiata]|uniref:MADS-box domain-containing protein n=1 Tax=Canavalia gladiata TaxID=3824 RepID=A0AAN9MVQ0_CANGL
MHHVTSYLEHLHQSTPFHGSNQIVIGNGQGLSISSIGNTCFDSLFPPNSTLCDVEINSKSIVVETPPGLNFVSQIVSYDSHDTTHYIALDYFLDRLYRSTMEFLNEAISEGCSQSKTRRGKMEIKRIENATNRQVTLCKRQFYTMLKLP